MVLNFIGNVFKYIEMGCIIVWVKYMDYVEVFVIDIGVGILKNELVLVIEWFYRVSIVIYLGI